MKDHHYNFMFYLIFWGLLIALIFLFKKFYTEFSPIWNIFLMLFIAIIITVSTYPFIIKNHKYKTLFNIHEVFGGKQPHKEFKDINKVSISKINEKLNQYIEKKNHIVSTATLVFIILIFISAIIDFYWILPLFIFYIFVVYSIMGNNIDFLKHQKWEKEELERKKFEEAQIKKGLVKFENKWGTFKQVKAWKEAKYGISNNFTHLSAFQLEHFVAKLFRKMGYTAEVTSKTGDYGVDVIARNKKDKIAIQVKHNKAGNNVANTVIQRVLGAMHMINANKAMVITTSDFTRQAYTQTRNAPIELWDSSKLKSMVRKYFIDVEEDNKEEKKSTKTLQEKLDKENYDLSDVPTEDKRAIKQQLMAERMERESRLK